MQIKQWITFHDPYSFIYGGYGRKDMAPGINGPASTVYKAATNVLQAHAAVYNLYNQAYKNTQNGKNIDICSIVWLNFHFFLIEWYESVFQLDFKIFRTIVSFIKISSGQSLIIKLIFIKFFKTVWEIYGQMSWDRCLAEALVNGIPYIYALPHVTPYS